MGAQAIIAAAQLRASRALLGIDQRKLADMACLSLPTIQRMEASDGRGNVDSLMKLIEALDAAGIELIGEGGGEPSRRPRRAAESSGMTLSLILAVAAAEIVLSALALPPSFMATWSELLLANMSTPAA